MIYYLLGSVSSFKEGGGGGGGGGDPARTHSLILQNCVLKLSDTPFDDSL